MANLDLRVDYKDDILDLSVNTKRKYNIIENEDGTKSLEDVSVYTQNGDSFGAADINKTNQAVLYLNSSLNMKYNPDTDTIQIFYNGIWNDWKTGGLQTHYLYNLGEFVIDMANGVYMTSEAAWTLSVFANTESGLYIPSLSNLEQKTIITNDIIDLSNYSALVIEYTYGGTNYKKQVDISTISSGYIEAFIVNFHGNISSSFGITTTKTGFIDNISVADSFYSGTGNTIPSDFYIQKLWLK